MADERVNVSALAGLVLVKKVSRASVSSLGGLVMTRVITKAGNPTCIDLSALAGLTMVKEVSQPQVSGVVGSLLVGDAERNIQPAARTLLTRNQI